MNDDNDGFFVVGMTVVVMATVFVLMISIMMGVGILGGGDDSETDPEPEPQTYDYIRADLDYSIEYKDVRNGDCYILTFTAPADGYIVAYHGSTGWMEEHMMFHKGHNSLVIERYSSVGRPTIDFYVEA